MPLVAEMRYANAMAQAPVVSTSTDSEILENFMEETVVEKAPSYDAAKKSVK